MIVRAARAGDIDAVNEVVEAAVLGWSLPERVKRLALHSYRYEAADLAHGAMRVALCDDGSIVGVATFQAADPREADLAADAMMLHGLYVHPRWQGRGVGSALLAVVLDAARYAGRSGVLVKASRDAIGFFSGRGFRRVESADTAAYPHLFYLPLPR